MAEKKLCPILALASGLAAAGRIKSVEGAMDCIEERCAWWVDPIVEESRYARRKGYCGHRNEAPAFRPCESEAIER